MSSAAMHRVLGCVLGCLLGVVLPQRAEAADFNDDGFADLAVGFFGEDVGADLDAGAVLVLYGSASGLSAAGSQFWSGDSPGLPGQSRPFDHFGYALAAGDFDDDGYDDLAVGAPERIVAGLQNAGAVYVLYGSASGLTAVGSQLWHQDSPGVTGSAASDDRFGRALASGDLDGDGYDDLAVGVWGETVGGAAGAGAVNILYGSAAGLAADRTQRWHRDSRRIRGSAESSDHFGASLVAADFDDDGFADLAVGAPFADYVTPPNDWNISVSYPNAGSVTVIYGSAVGLTADGNQLWHEDSPGIPGIVDGDERFGQSLAAGDLDGDGYADLAVGVPYEAIGGAVNAGAVNVIYGSARGLSAAGSQRWHQDSAGIAETAEEDDLFGESLAVGDLDHDGYADLAVGVPSEDVGDIADAGAVNAIYGSGAGLTAAGDQLWHQDSAGIGSAAELRDNFGKSLAVGDFDADLCGDLVVGVPFEDLGMFSNPGAVHILFGDAAGLSGTGSEMWSQAYTGSPDAQENYDGFGSALAP